MAGIGDLVGVLLQGGMTRSGSSRIENSLGASGLGGAGDLLEQVLGSGNDGGDLLSGLLGAAKGAFSETSRTVKENPLAAGGLGALAGALFGGGGGSVKGALGGGAIAMLAGLAFKAMRGNSAPASVAELPLGLRAPVDAQEEQELEQSGRLVLKGMINAAKADGQIDQEELQRLVGKLREAGADDDIQAWVESELRGPMDLDGLVNAIPNQQVAAEVYAASLFAVEVDTPAEQRYLQELASRTGLQPQVVQALHIAVGLT